MPFTFKPQCCDADFYLWMGQGCADNLFSCWHGLRPVGSQFYFSLPFRVGLTGDWLIPLNALVVGLSALAGVPAVCALLPTIPRFVKWALAAAFLGIHLFFLGGILRNTLSDLPASISALLFIWTTFLASARGKKRLYVASGLALGLSAMVRVFFLYPVLLSAASVLVVTGWRKETRSRALSFAVACAIPLLIQLTFTRLMTGYWTFIDRQSTAYGAALHFETISYGYDTILPAVGLRYDATQCFVDAYGMGDALRKHEWREALCLIKYREWFYFGSYTAGGEVYIPDATYRHFSIWFLLGNIVSVLLAGWWMLSQSLKRPLLASVVIFLGAIWGQGAMIIPETRFMIAFYVASWILACGGAVEAALELMKRRARKAPDAEMHPASG